MESLLKLLGVYIYIYSHNVHVISLVITATVHFDQHLDYIYIYSLETDMAAFAQGSKIL